MKFTLCGLIYRILNYYVFRKEGFHSVQEAVGADLKSDAAKS